MSIIISDAISKKAASLSIGTTTRLDHWDCPAGQDTKRRLYLTRPEHTPKIVLLFCHNCGEGGLLKLNKYYSSGSDYPYEISISPSVPPPKIIATNLTQFLGDIKGRGPKCASNLYLDIAKVVTDGFSIYVPIYHNDVYIGFQSRSLEAPSGGPKWVSHFIKGFQGWVDNRTWIPLTSDSPVFIVEDYISMCALTSVGVLSVCMFGTNASLPRSYNISKEFEDHPIVVWFDNDNEQVIHNANKLVSNFSLLGHKTNRYINKLSPKEINQLDLRKRVKEWNELLM